MRILLKCAIAGLALACGDTTDPDPPKGSVGDATSLDVVITENSNGPQWPADPVTIQSAVVKGDSLELSVSFGGGCRDHEFVLLSDAAWMESYPVQVGVRLAHDANGDNCKALLSRLLRFNLGPLRSAYQNSYQSSTGIIRLRIAGLGSSPLYAW